MTERFPVIDLVATGENIARLRKARGLSVRDVQNWFGFEEPQAIYKWQRGKSLPTVDNLYALGALLGVPMEEILVPCRPQLNIVNNGQQDVSCCPAFLPGSFEYGRISSPCYHFDRPHLHSAGSPKDGLRSFAGTGGRSPEGRIHNNIIT